MDEYIILKQTQNINALTNLVYMNVDDISKLNKTGLYTVDLKGNLYVEFILDKKNNFDRIVYSVCEDIRVEQGYITLSGPQRDNLRVNIGSTVKIKPYENLENNVLSNISINIETFVKNNTSNLELDYKKLISTIEKSLSEKILRVGQKFIIENKRKLIITIMNIKNILGFDNITFGCFSSGVSSININETENITLIGIINEKTNIFDKGFNFNQLGIGGLDSEFETIFKRAFASRMFPDSVVSQMGINHVKGMLLYGPPGCGKTLIARQLGKALNSREPKIVNGPEILNRYIGASEENIRDLFADAEKEQKEQGSNSMLHIIIFDEFDAICKKRGSNHSHGVNDQVVNQLLSKIDGVNSLNNVLIIGMTNRKDDIDDAILRPGRLEVHVEINLPNKDGRLQILKIHTDEMRKSSDKRITNECIDNLDEIAEKAENYTGAELTGLIRLATSNAMDRCINKETFKVNSDDLCVDIDDFLFALKEIKPMFGSSNDKIELYYRNGMIDYGVRFREIISKLETVVNHLKTSNNLFNISILLEGNPMTGKTAIAAFIAVKSKFPFVNVISAKDMIGMHEHEKCIHIKDIFISSSKSPQSIIILDDIERIIEYNKIGFRFSNSILQTLLLLINSTTNKNKTMILGTTSNIDMIENLEITFNMNITIPLLNEDEISIVLKSMFDDFTYKYESDIGIKKLIIDNELNI
jgi:vesicle-fusing ATPase